MVGFYAIKIRAVDMFSVILYSGDMIISRGMYFSCLSL